MNSFREETEFCRPTKFSSPADKIKFVGRQNIFCRPSKFVFDGLKSFFLAPWRRESTLILRGHAHKMHKGAITNCNHAADCRKGVVSGGLSGVLLDEGAGLLHKGEEGVDCFGAEHGDAVLAKIGDALEQRAVGYVATGVEDAGVLAEMLYAGAHLLLEDVELPVGA